MQIIKKPNAHSKVPIKIIQIYISIQIKSSPIFKCPVCSSQWRPCCYLSQTSVQREAMHISLFYQMLYSTASCPSGDAIKLDTGLEAPHCLSTDSTMRSKRSRALRLKQQLVFLNSCLHSAVRAGTKPEWMLFISADHCLRVHIPKAHLRCLPRGEAILAIIPLPLVSNGDRGHGLIWTDWAECQVMLWQGITSSYEELSLMINDYGKLESIWCGSENVLSVSAMQTVMWKYTDLSAVSISCLTAIVLFDHQSLLHYIISFSRNR